MLIEKNGDILTADEQYICHQTNCTTRKFAGLAAAIFTAFSYADTYSNRKRPSIPGTIDVCGNGVDQRFVVNMNAQYYPGRPSYDTLDEFQCCDSMNQRLIWFEKCLHDILQLNVQSIAFPFGIGCGMGGGEWSYYRAQLEIFEHMLKQTNPDATVSLYRLT